MAIGDKIRIKIDSLILGPIKSKQEEIKKLINSIRQGTGGDDVKKAEEFVKNLDEFQNQSKQIENLKSQVESALNAASTLKTTAAATREDSIIGSALNPAAAAISIVQEKLVKKFEEEIEDAKSAIDGVGPALKQVSSNIKDMKKDLKNALKKNEDKKKAKEQRDALLGKGGIN